MRYLDFVVELSSLEEFEDDVEGVFGLEDFVESHGVLVVEVPHDFDFLDQALLSLVLAVGSFLREGLDSVGHFVFELLRQIDRGEVALADFLDRLELLVETPLVQSSPQN